jgi:hypothetical protein
MHTLVSFFVVDLGAFLTALIGLKNEPPLVLGRNQFSLLMEVRLWNLFQKTTVMTYVMVEAPKLSYPRNLKTVHTET